MNDISVIQSIVNIGIASGIAVYLVFWITKSLNGKLNDLKNEISKLNTNIEKLIYILEER